MSKNLYIIEYVAIGKALLQVFIRSSQYPWQAGREAITVSMGRFCAQNLGNLWKNIQNSKCKLPIILLRGPHILLTHQTCKDKSARS